MSKLPMDSIHLMVHIFIYYFVFVKPEKKKKKKKLSWPLKCKRKMLKSRSHGLVFAYNLFFVTADDATRGANDVHWRDETFCILKTWVARGH
jgi:hypothetical protein